MEYRRHSVIKQIIAKHSKAPAPCAFDILSINPNAIPAYANLISRYQDLIRRYDRLEELQQKNVQLSINNITKHFTQLFKQSVCGEANAARTLYVLSLINNIERKMSGHVAVATQTAALSC